eukprot:gb/GECG01016269.1/.p1 GENE.gb/GECG01016269.1/~~gb/GECG01016269.1/.p1  ORF type:complete len:136 (+),score=22.91 gb/GECG01016269.1/:1-408(+)
MMSKKATAPRDRGEREEIFYELQRLKKCFSSDHISLEPQWKREETHQMLQKQSEAIERRRLENQLHGPHLRGKIGLVVGPLLFLASLLFLVDKPSGTTQREFGTIAVFFLVGTQNNSKNRFSSARYALDLQERGG